MEDQTDTEKMKLMAQLLQKLSQKETAGERNHFGMQKWAVSTNNRI